MAYQEKTERGHEEPYAVQFSLFLANRVGQLRDLLAIFVREEIHVVGLSIVDATDWAVVRVVFTDPNRAREKLRSDGLPFTESEVLLIEVPAPEAMGDICENLLRAEVNVHFAYALTLQNHDHPVMVFHVDDWVLATHVLMKAHYILLGSEDLAEPS